jgi:hypothetical protein
MNDPHVAELRYMLVFGPGLWYAPPTLIDHPRPEFDR